MIKRLAKSSTELIIAQFLTAKGRRHDPRNHCVPILAVLPDPIDDNVALIVMPALLTFSINEFVVVSEVVDFMFQTLEVCLFRVLNFRPEIAPHSS